MTDEVFLLLLQLVMASDPWPLREPVYDIATDILDRESELRGFDDWVHAYHEFKIEVE